YKGLPVLLDKMPPQIAPYQLRLDWQMWFASMYTPAEYPWTLNLEWKLLHNDPKTLSLFAGNPFPATPPRYIRAVLYHYSFAKPGNTHGLWWTREKVSNWLPALSVDDPRLIAFLKSYGWL
ncbi:MAG TPA: lipase maturation factor family protein, partial [Parafilimonas sp.]|nr:lipase maturation factor family protein [Parafilimonas sp.]